MSLEELRAKAESEEEVTEEVTPEVEEEDEPTPEEEEGSSTDAAEDEPEPEPSEDFELELDGEPEPGQQKPNAEQALVHKLTKQRKRRQEAETEAEKLRRELDELKARISGGQQPSQPAQQQPQGTPKFPDYYAPGIDGDPEKYDRAVKQFLADMESHKHSESQRNSQQEEYQRQIEEKTLSLATRAAAFGKEHKISNDRLVSAIERATGEIDSAAKVDGALAHLLDSVGDGGERVAYYIGTNDNAMSKVKELLSGDPSGLKAIAHMTRLAYQLKPKHAKRISAAPSPDEPLKGDGSPASAKRLQEQYDKATEPGELLKLRQKARELGVKLT